VLYILFPVLLIGQTGPGGISNCVLWLRADAGTINGSSTVSEYGNVTQWIDQSASGNSSTSYSSSPYKVQSNSSPERSMNYNPVVLFDEATDGFQGPNLGLNGATSLSEFYVFKSAPAPNPGTNYIAVFSLGYQDTGGQNSSHRFENDPYTGSYMIFDDAWVGHLASAASLDSYYYQSIKGSVYNGITYRGYANGTQTSSKNTSIGVNGLGGYRIGVCEPGAQSTFSAGEVIIFNRAISSTERQKVDSYLAIKYGITLKNTGAGISGDYVTTAGTTIWDASDGASYHNNVIGIGREDAYTLYQKQSHSSDESIRVYRGNLVATNLYNSSFIQNSAFLLMGDNQGALHATDESNDEVPNSCGFSSRLEREWKVYRSNLGGSFGLDITLDVGALPGTVTHADLHLIVDDDGDFRGGTSNCYANGDGVTIAYNNPVISITGISTSIIPKNSKRYITIGSTDIRTPLPVTLTYFNATPVNDSFVTLDWETLSEINNDYFSIERSVDALTWETIAIVEGAGNSSSQLTYSAIDDKPENGASYYRLKQTDFNGEFEYSSIVSVYFLSLDENVDIYPNPTQSLMTVESNNTELGELEIYNLLGENVTQQIKSSEINKMMVAIDLSGLSEGVYFVKTAISMDKIYKY
jgi:hypothetical protein